MLIELQSIIYKEENDRYVECHNAIRHIIEDHIGTAESVVIDEIMLAVLKRYKS